MVEKPSWYTPAVQGLAREIKARWDPSLLPILADALEEGGYAHKGLLNHLRQDSHDIGWCWVVDSLVCPRGDSWKWQELCRLAGAP